MTTQPWCAKSCLEAWYARSQHKPSNTPHTKIVTIADEEIPLVLLEESYNVTACSVTQYGDTYLPIFERLHRELNKQSAKQLLLKKAFDISVGNSEKGNWPTYDK